ncbi:MAG: hypothetical protein IJS50_03905 [Desulfovibrio sp.]|nr:hypothetical protein [Desulfovibrio sp.]
MKKFLIIPLILLLAACGSKKPDFEETSPPSSEEASEKTSPQTEMSSTCSEAWILGPSHLLVELAAGNEVFLDPSQHDFPLYCSENEAQAKAQSLLAQGKIKPESVVLYKLKGDGESLAKMEGKQRFLAREAALETWEGLKRPKKRK